MQDRLKKELRLQNISTIEEANSFLPSFFDEYNKKFAKIAKDSINAHRSLTQEMDIERIFTIQEKRILSKNLTFQYRNKIFQVITSRSIYTLRKAQITLLENRKGEIIAEYKGKSLNYTIYEERPLQAEEVSAKELNTKIDDIRKRKYKPPKHHPWKSYYPRTCAV